MINVVQVGYGYWGPNVAKNIMASKNVNLHAICDIYESCLDKAKVLYSNNVNYSADYRTFLSNPEIDAFAVVIQTEPSYQVALDVLNAGKHLFIEKPMASNSERAQQICELADKKGLVVHCDHIMIYHPIIREIKRMYDNGELGDLVYFDINRTNLGPIRMDVNSMLDLAVHDLAIIDWISDGKQPYHIEAIGEKRYGNQETLTYLTMKYPGFLAHIKSSWISPLKERRIVICGTKKMVIFDDMRSVDKLTVYDQGIIERDKNDEYGNYEFKVRTGNIVIPFINHEDALRNSIEHFVSCIKQKGRSLSGPEQALRVIKILDQAMSKL
jgi:predicted dehydrogenase